MSERYAGSRTFEIASARFQAPNRMVERTVAVGTTVATVLPENPRRLMWVIMNRATNAGAIGFTPGVSFADGLLLGADGSSVSMSVDEDGEAVGYAVYGLLSSGSGTFYVLEVIAL